MKIYKTLLIFILCLHYTITPAQTISTYSINAQEIKDLTKLVDKNTLVIIDIDSTIVRPKSKIFLPNSPYRRLIDSLITACINAPNSRYNQVLANWYIQRQQILLEQSWPNFIKNLENMGAYVVGIAQLNKVIYSTIKEPEVWKYKELAALGIDFTKNIGGKNLLQISTIKSKQAVFYNGIIFTGPFAKAETLVNFLRVSTLMPRKVIIFSDKENELKQMQYATRTINLDFYAVYYQALQQINEKVNDRVAEFQQQNLLKKGLWIEDDKAEELIKLNP